MGLTIHYSLTLPAETTTTEVKAKLEALRQSCLDLPFKEVADKLINLKGKKCDFQKCDNEDPNRWLLIQSNIYVNYTDDYFHGIRPLRDKEELSCYSLGVSPKEIVAFSAWPAEGCEEANFGVCLFPKTVSIKSSYKLTDSARRLKIEEAKNWHWNSFCKTQYANNPNCGGVKNFLRAHLLVIKTLDKAKELGFGVDVSDEGNYWTKRSVEELTKDIGEWDNFIAKMGGQLKDAFSNDKKGCSVEALIFKDPRFEHLEADGHNTTA